MNTFEPPPFLPDRLMRGGHLQTLASLRTPREQIAPQARHVVELPDGDAIVLHENAAVDGGDRTANNGQLKRAAKVLVLYHGLSGCHGSPYMIRLTSRFVRQGWTVIRVDMRGCGAAWELARGLSHAGRSDDVQAALEFVARRYSNAKIAAIGVSLGGNQLLRFVGRVGASLQERPNWFDQLAGVATVAPPIDLVRCSENMERLSRRIYNYYFIRTLFDRIAPRVRDLELFQEVASLGRPKTLFELDDRLTAPLSGFAGATDYYQQCGASSVAMANSVPTLVLAARNDPIVPVDCFTSVCWPPTTRMLIRATGGHAGFAARGRRHWMDDCLAAWVNQL